MVKIQARKEKRYNTDVGAYEDYVWDIWVDITIQTTYIRNYEKTDRIAQGLPTEAHADLVLRDFKLTLDGHH